MISITDSLFLRRMLPMIRRGRLLSAVDFVRLTTISRASSMDSISVMVEDARTAYRRRVESGRRFSAVQAAALSVIDPALYSQYQAQLTARSRAKSVADRVAEHVSRRSDIGDIPEVCDLARREYGRSDLVFFGVTYCGVLLKHAPSENMREFIDAMRDAILHGGRVHVRWPRGKGKSTWIKIGILWALLYGHRKFAVCFAASARNAKATITDIWKTIEKSDPLLADFPEVAVPVRALGGVVQRCATQCCNGTATEILRSSEVVRLPRIEGSVSSGAMVFCRGVQSGTRGLVDMDTRPDFLFFDDIQTKKTSRSKTATDWLEEFVQDDAMCMGGHDFSIAALMASTPIRVNDLSERFADKERHPEWITFTTPLVLRWSDNEELVEEFGRLYKRDLANRDPLFTMSRVFYAEHQAEIEAGVEVLDPLDGDRAKMVSAFHHALVLFFSMGCSGFNAEYQMQTRREDVVFHLEPERICAALNGYERCVVPDECRGVVGFVDVNAEAGMRWEVMAFGAGRVGATIAYGRWPVSGRLYRENSTTTQMRVAVAQGVIAVARHIAALPIRRASGARVAITALCYDLGWETKAVARAIKTLRMPFHTIGSRGYGWRKYQPYKPGGDKREGVVGEVGDHCHLSESPNGVFLAMHTDYWREEAQRAFLAPPLSPGSCSLWGADKTEHYEFASEVCNERLADRGVGENGAEFWLWNKTGANHYGDTHTGCHAVASWYRLYDATEALVERAVSDGKRGVTAAMRTKPAARAGLKRRFKLVRKNA